VRVWLNGPAAGIECDPRNRTQAVQDKHRAHPATEMPNSSASCLRTPGERAALVIADIARGAPISRDTECFSMHSDMSRRTIAVSSLNRYSANALVPAIAEQPGG
jgi:hypothetical protein